MGNVSFDDNCHLSPMCGSVGVIDGVVGYSEGMFWFGVNFADAC